MMVPANKAVLIDRDGTMVKSAAGQYRDFELLPTVADGIKLFNEYDFRVVMLAGLQPRTDHSPVESDTETASLARPQTRRSHTRASTGSIATPASAMET